MTGVVRWKFTDVRTLVSYTVPINPNEGGTPTISKQVATNMPMGPNRTAVFSEGRLSITDMQFAGATLTQAHVEALQDWSLKRTLVQIDDDLGRRFQGIITSLSLSRTRRAANVWYHTYSASFGITYMRSASGVVQYGALPKATFSAFSFPSLPTPSPPPLARPFIPPVIEVLPPVTPPPVTPPGAPSQVVTYTQPTGAPDAAWKTWINGAATWTHYTTRGATAHYSTNASAPVPVTMTAPTTVTSCEVKVSQEGVWPPPKVNPTFTGKNISFTLPTGFLGHAMVRINAGLGWQSFCTVSALPLETDVPASGAVTYYFGPGVHTGSTISLASNATVYIAGGALVKRRFVAGAIGTNTTGQRSNIRVWGRGIIDTSNGYGPTDQGMGAGDFAGVSGLTFEGIGYVSRYSWALAAYRCTNVLFDRVRVFSCEIPDAPDYPGQGTPDGIDPIGCDGFTVKRSLISAADDSSAIKMSKYGMEGNANNHLYQDLLLIQGGKSNGMDIGYEFGNNGLSVTGVTYRRVYAPICWRDQQPFRTSALGIHVATIATVDGVLYEDCRFDEARNKDFDLFVSTFHTSSFGSNSGDANRGNIRNITYRRVEFPGDKPIRITADLTDPNYGGGSKKITNVTFDNCTRNGVRLTARQGDWTVTNANVVFSSVIEPPPVEPPTGPPTGPPAGYAVYPTGAANFAAGCNASTNTYLPAATYSFNGFSSGPSSFNTFGAKLEKCVSLAGAGMDRTFIKMNPNTSTEQSMYAGLKTPDANPFNLVCLGTGSGRGGGPKVTVQDLTVTGGNNQGHMYNGLFLMYSNAPVVRNVKVTGIPGDSSSPPGETFSLSLYDCLRPTVQGCVIDGRPDGAGSTGIAASLLGLNNSDHATVNDTIIRYNNVAFAVAAWQSTGGDFTRCTFDHCKRVPIHIENCDGVWNFTDCTWSNISSGEYHAVIATSKDYVSGQNVLNFYDPVFDTIPGRAAGFWVRIVAWAGISQRKTVGSGSTPGAVNLYVDGVLRPDLVHLQIG